MERCFRCNIFTRQCLYLNAKERNTAEHPLFPSMSPVCSSRTILDSGSALFLAPACGGSEMLNWLSLQCPFLPYWAWGLRNSPGSLTLNFQKRVCLTTDGSLRVEACQQILLFTPTKSNVGFSLGLDALVNCCT